MHNIATLKLGLRAARPPTRRQGKTQSPRPCREASQRVCAGCAPGAGGGARPRTFRSSEAPAWPPARAAGWKASPKGRRRHEKGCFSGHGTGSGLTRTVILLKIHMTGKATHAVRRISRVSQRAVRSDTRSRQHATRDTRPTPEQLHSSPRAARTCGRRFQTQTHPTYPTPQGSARSASALLAAPPAHCSSSSRVPAQSPASPVV